MIEILPLIVDIIMLNIQMIYYITNRITQEKIAKTLTIVITMYNRMGNTCVKSWTKNNYHNKMKKVWWMYSITNSKEKINWSKKNSFKVIIIII